ncbi:hypothetical protein CC78DRAFT_155549 [Lojkania enalia]|uniref:INSIG domain-containing protein n=1 Tax=Lojkania enalia TaxID=147567 RepID=A0A9P4KHN3_9PLEO|nr:hypothetical protein CC78DRAFT_155549 [Didymosphaeria enalia]
MAEDPFVSATAPQSQPHIYRPIPRRNFPASISHSLEQDEEQEPHTQNTPPTDNSSQSGDWLAQLNARLLRTRTSSSANLYEHGEGGGSIGRNKSLLNMTKSTLFGIYDEAGASTAGEQSEAQTPWGTGAETPTRKSLDSGLGIGRLEGVGDPDGGLRMKQMARGGTIEGAVRQGTRSRQGVRQQRHGGRKGLVVVGKVAALFLFGLVYGVLVSHLHDTRELAELNVGGPGRESWKYLTSWGLASVVLGNLLPYVELLWNVEGKGRQIHNEPEKETESSLTEQWSDVVRSVGAFFGIAFAIRRLPWQSTLQLTITLALVNPALWYILDRSKPGLSFSLLVTSVLTSFIFLSNPDVLPSPALPATTNATHLPSSARTGAQQQYQEELFAGVVSYENLAVVTWVGSVLFCSCVCFGSIGRRLAVLDEWGLRR